PRSARGSASPARPHSRDGERPPDPAPGEPRNRRSAQLTTHSLLTDLLTRLPGIGKTRRDTGDTRRGPGLVSETRRNAGDGGDMRRMAHNPEVAGSNPAPATSFRR